MPSPQGRLRRPGCDRARDRRTGFAAKVEELALAQEIPISFLENILTQLKSAGIARSQHGQGGGDWLARPPQELTLAQIIRAVEGPLVGVRNQPPEQISHAGSAEQLQKVWVRCGPTCVRCASGSPWPDVPRGELLAEVLSLTRDEDAWHMR